MNLFDNLIFDNVIGNMAQELNIDNITMQKFLLETMDGFLKYKHGFYKNNYYWADKILK